jgi:thymidylate kinase
MPLPRASHRRIAGRGERERERSDEAQSVDTMRERYLALADLNGYHVVRTTGSTTSAALAGATPLLESLLASDAAARRGGRIPA